MTVILKIFSRIESAVTVSEFSARDRGAPNQSCIAELGFFMRCTLLAQIDGCEKLPKIVSKSGTRRFTQPTFRNKFRSMYVQEFPWVHVDVAQFPPLANRGLSSFPFNMFVFLFNMFKTSCARAHLYNGVMQNHKWKEKKPIFFCLNQNDHLNQNDNILQTLSRHNPQPYICPVSRNHWHNCGMM